MNIMYLCWEFPPAGSGIGAYIYQMSRALADAGHAVVVVTSRVQNLPDVEKLGANGQILRIYEYNQIGSKNLGRVVLDISRRHRVDWIEVADHLGEGMPLISEKNRPPVFVKCHYNDVIYRIRYGQVRWWWQRFLIDAACLRDHKRLGRERQSLSKADGLIYINRQMQKEIKDASLPIPKRTTVIPNPIGEILEWQNIEAIHPTILFVGRIDFGKGADFLPDLLRSILLRFPNARLEIAGGDGFARGIGSIKKWLVKKFGALLKNVTFLGHVDQSQLDKAYSRAWVVVVPSRWDTFPMSILEAMARGKAIVASPYGGIPEMLEGTSNTSVRPNSPMFNAAVVDFLGNQNLRRKAGSSGREKVLAKYHPSRIAKQYVSTLAGWL